MSIVKVSLTMLVGFLFVGCASDNLKAPCSDYGSSCDKTPVNSWDTSSV